MFCRNNENMKILEFACKYIIQLQVLIVENNNFTERLRESLVHHSLYCICIYVSLSNAMSSAHDYVNMVCLTIKQMISMQIADVNSIKSDTSFVQNILWDACAAVHKVSRLDLNFAVLCQKMAWNLFSNTISATDFVHCHIRVQNRYSVKRTSQMV